MVLFRAGRLISLVNKPHLRRASYINPKFEGGKAKPHEFGKNIRQKLFEQGEMYFFIPLFVVLASYVVFGPSSAAYEKFQQDRFDEWRTIYNYPYPERDESDE